MAGASTRRPIVAGRFYEGSSAGLKAAVERCVAGYEPPDDLGDVVGGVAPHAGWTFSGPTAAKVFTTLATKAGPDTYILLGAVHRPTGRGPAVYPSGAWSTPLGEATVNEALASAIAEAGAGLIAASDAAHEREHSIEVLVPFVQALSPEADIVPISVPPAADAVRVGEIVAAVVSEYDKRAVVVASTDLTHYGMSYGMPDRGPLPGAMPWMRENDQRFIRLVEALQAEKIVPAARALGARQARLLEYTTSADVMGETRADSAVGYAALVFEK